VRIWVDLTNSPHVLVMRPLIEIMRAEGHNVEVTARDFAQTLELCERFGIEHTALGRHRGGRLASKGVGLLSRSGALLRWARGRRFDVAIGHGSNDISVAAWLLRIPSATAFDYEFANAQHQVNCRLCRIVMVPHVIPPERLRPFGATAAKLRRYEGLKEEYYLADFEPDEAVLGELGLSRERPLVVVRTPPEVSLYHRFENPLFTRVLERLAASDAQTVVLPRTPTQREEIARLGSFSGAEARGSAACAGFIIPARAVDAQSLVAYADLVISAGGTMNREAVALGTPVYTTFEGRLGAVDEALLHEGRLHKLGDPREIRVERRRSHAGLRTRRDPRELVRLLLQASKP
jgi:predicted glycosyltransferase